MSCAFDLDHYRELLEAAQAGSPFQFTVSSRP